MRKGRARLLVQLYEYLPHLQHLRCQGAHSCSGSARWLVPPSAAGPSQLLRSSPAGSFPLRTVPMLPPARMLPPIRISAASSLACALPTAVAHICAGGCSEPTPGMLWQGGFCSQVDYFPNATIAEYGRIIGEDAMQAEIFARGPIACSLNSEPLHTCAPVLTPPSPSPHVA